LIVIIVATEDKQNAMISLEIYLKMGKGVMGKGVIKSIKIEDSFINFKQNGNKTTERLSNELQSTFEEFRGHTNN